MKTKGIAWLLAIVMFLTATPVHADDVKRIQGNNRFDTAVQISQETFESSDTVLLANGKNYVDALPASTLANHLKAPILLTEAEQIPEATLQEMTRLGATKAIVLGGTATVQNSVITKLQSRGMEVTRIGGEDRYKTSEQIFLELQGKISVKRIFVAGAVADAVSSGALRGDSSPLLFVNNASPSEMIKELKTEKIVLGGENSVSEKTLEAIGATQRIGGGNRYETAVQMAERYREESGSANAVLVNGNEFIDALTVATYAHAQKRNILLTPGTYLDPHTKKWSDEHNTDFVLIGGHSSVADVALTQTEPPKTASKQITKKPEKEKPDNVDPSRPMIALTFDDGPINRSTERILNALKASNAKATFFVLGLQANKYPEIVKRAVQEGHEIGNHSYSHKKLSNLSIAEIQDELEKTNRVVENAAGVTPVLTRPTYGSVNQTLRDAVTTPLINWSVDPRDWETRNADTTVSHILERVQDGDIILLHDIYGETATAVEELVPKLVAKGYQLVTVSELFRNKGISLEAGVVYNRAR